MATNGHTVPIETLNSNGSVASEAANATSPSSSATAGSSSAAQPTSSSQAGSSESSSSSSNHLTSMPQLFVPVTGPITAAEYSKMVSDWQLAYSSWLQASCAHYGALISGAVAAPLQAAFQINSLAAITAQANTRSQRVAAVITRTPTISRASYSIPSLWRRVAAECIDMILLFVLRSLVTLILFRNGFFKTSGDRGVTMERIFSILASDFLGTDEDEDDFLANFARNSANTAHDNLESTLDDLLNITSQLVIVECIALIFYTIYEVFSLCRTSRRIGGATVGKALMGLKVVQHDISRMRSGTMPNTILVANVQTPTFWRALLRSVIKNFSASVMFPASLTVFFYSHRLAVYDILAASTVVESASEREVTNEHAD